MAAQWTEPDLSADDAFTGDPAELVDAAGLLGELLARPAWHADAACREHPEVSWFPERGQPLEPARTVCEGCLVRSECLDYAQSLAPAPAGVWGGTSERERRIMRQT